jgi:hypothetical protein
VPSAAVTVAVIVILVFVSIGCGDAVIVVVVAVSGGGVPLEVYDEPSADRVTYLDAMRSCAPVPPG